MLRLTSHDYFAGAFGLAVFISGATGVNSVVNFRISAEYGQLASVHELVCFQRRLDTLFERFDVDVIFEPFYFWLRLARYHALQCIVRLGVELN